MNNPLRYTDPSGHYVIEGPGGVYVSPPVPHRVNRPSDLAGRIGVEAQYIETGNPAEKNYNLCPHFSFIAIYEIETGEKYTLDMMWKRLPTTSPIGHGKLVELIESFPGWSAGYLGMGGWFIHHGCHSQNRTRKTRNTRRGGKYPIELAGYDVLKLPISQILRGRLLNWLNKTLGELVPSLLSSQIPILEVILDRDLILSKAFSPTGFSFRRQICSIPNLQISQHTNLLHYAK